MAGKQGQAAAMEMRRDTSWGKGLRQGTARLVRQNPTMAAGIVIVVVMVLIALFAPVLFTDDPNAVYPFDRFTSPSSDSWFGTDVVGRDVYSRTIYGSRVSLIVAAAVAAITTLLSVIIGLLVGYYRWVDMVVMRVMDGLMSIPAILLAIALTAVFGGSVQNVILALCVVETPRTVRVVRSAVLSLREQMFVDAARAVGAPTYRILARHLLAEHRRAAHRTGDLHRRLGRPAGSLRELPRGRCVPGYPYLGQHHGPGTPVPDKRGVDNLLPWRIPYTDGLGNQHRGGRTPRPA